MNSLARSGSNITKKDRMMTEKRGKTNGETCCNQKFLSLKNNLQFIQDRLLARETRTFQLEQRSNSQLVTLKLLGECCFTYLSSRNAARKNVFCC